MALHRAPFGEQGKAIGARSRAEFDRARRITPGGSMRAAPYFPPQPPYAMRGKGCWVTDLDGRAVFDCANNFFSLVHGHAFEPVCSALHAAIDAGTAFGLPTTAETELAEEISKRSPDLEQVRFANSGTEAVMFAVKAARAITGRPAIAKFEGAYHGAYDPVEVSLDPTPQNWGEPYPASVAYARGTPASITAETVVLPFNDPAACRLLLERHRDRLAAVVFDPLSSRAAMVPASEGLLDALRDSCAQHGILLVLDEVVCYRLDYRGAYARFALKPDLVALGKVMGGGMAAAAVAGPARHMAVFDHTKGKPPVSHGGTFSANPLAMVAGVAALRAYDEPAVNRLNSMGDGLRHELNARLASTGAAAQVTGMGSLFRLHLKNTPVTDYRTAFPSAEERQRLARIHFDLLESGYLLTPSCSGALSTPMSESELHDLATAIVQAVRKNS